MDPIATRELLEHADFVRRIALAIAGDEHGADDLVQDTWITALTRPRPAGAQGARLRGWLGGVVRNVARDARRGAGRRRVREEAAARPEGLPPTDDTVGRIETHRRVVSAVLELSPPLRQAVVLTYFDGLPPRAVARRLGLPVETVRTRVRRARERLRARLESGYESRPALVAALLDVARHGAPATAGSTPAPVAAAPLAGPLALAALAVATVAFVGFELAGPGRANELDASPSTAAVAARVASELGGPDGARPADPGRQVGRRASRRAPAPLETAGDLAGKAPQGRVIVIDVDGGELAHERGEFRLRPIDVDGEARVLAFADGRFALEGLPLGTVQIELASIATDDGPRPVVFENAQVEHVAGEPLVVRGALLRDSILSVVHADTGAELERVSVLPAPGSSTRAHPGPHFDSACCVRNSPSPVRLPRVRGQRWYWVTASGCTWTLVAIDHDTGGRREVRVTTAGSLAVDAAGHPAQGAVHLRVRAAASERIAAECTLDRASDGAASQTFTGLAPGPYDVSAEIGQPDDPPRVLAAARAVVSAGTTTRVFLEPRCDLPPRVAVSGTLRLPADRADLPIALSIRPATLPALRFGDVQRIERERMRRASSGLAGELRWRADGLTPGRYVAVVEPIQYRVLFDVPNRPVDDVHIVVPTLQRVVVRAVDAETGAPLERARLRFARELPDVAGPEAWWDFGHAEDRDHATLWVPAGRIFVAGSGPAHGQRFVEATIGDAPLELTLALPRRIPVEVTLSNGDARIPWTPSMTCTYRGVGDDEASPCVTRGDGRMHAWVDEPGLYEIRAAGVDGDRDPEPIVVAVTEAGPTAPVVIRIER